MNNATRPIVSLGSRREFLKTTGAAVALGAMSSAVPIAYAGKGANDTIGVGHIGLGTRGGDLINLTAACRGVKIVAVCDVYKPHLQKGVQRSLNPDVKTYNDYHDLLADKNVDAVVIATPDHWHCQIVLDAVAAGKDVYCEKGLSRTLPEAKRMRDAIKQSKCVFQLGHQARQATAALQAKELIAQGALGPITLVRTGRYGNLAPDKAIWRWYGYYTQFDRPDPAKVIADLDWKRWLGACPEIPFNERHFWHWRCYWRYGTGQAGDLLSHEMDFVQYLLGYGVPDTCICSGLNALLKDDREVPDTWTAIYEFEKKGCTVTFNSSMNTSVSQNVELCGKEATLRFDGIAHNVTNFEVIPERFNKKPGLQTSFESSKTPRQPNHQMDFFNCVRSRGLPKCNVDEAFIETATALMSIESFNQKRMVRWDPEKEEIV